MASVYDSIAHQYVKRYRANPRGPWPFSETRIDRLFQECTDPNTCIDSPVMLDLGCGNGLPFLREFAECGYKTVGVDCSKIMIEMASEHVPAAKLYHKHMEDMKFGPQTFDVVVANQSILHLPREMHLSMFKKIREWLKGGGRFLYSGPNGDNKGNEKEWLGARVYESHYDFETTCRLMEEAGFLFDYKEQDNDDIWIQAFA